MDYIEYKIFFRYKNYISIKKIVNYKFKNGIIMYKYECVREVVCFKIILGYRYDNKNSIYLNICL